MKRLSDIIDSLEEDMPIKVDMKRGAILEGIVGEIRGDKIYFFHNEIDFNGGVGDILPKDKGYRLSWCIDCYSSHEEIEILPGIIHPTLNQTSK